MENEQEAMTTTFFPGVKQPEQVSGPALWFVFQENKILVEQEASAVCIPYRLEFAEIGLEAISRNYLGSIDGHHCFAVEVAAGTAAPPGMSFEGLRQVYGTIDEDLFWIAGRAVQIVDWDRTHKFCGCCGIPTRKSPAERARECPRCGLQEFPRLAPAIIVLVHRDNEMLLARSRRFPTAMYSTLAGFVEPGENLENAVLREVEEETGIVVRDIRYFGSQPWPFPHSLMIGFTAAYARGEIVLEDNEIVDARWFTADNLPSLLPGKISIARRLVDWFLDKQKKSSAE